jgi:hypothetical protein
MREVFFRVIDKRNIVPIHTESMSEEEILERASIAWREIGILNERIEKMSSKRVLVEGVVGYAPQTEESESRAMKGDIVPLVLVISEILRAEKRDGQGENVIEKRGCTGITVAHQSRD